MSKQQNERMVNTKQQVLQNEEGSMKRSQSEKEKQQQWKLKCKILQKLLKQEHSMLWTQNEQKQLFEKKLLSTIVSYYRNKIHSLSNVKPSVQLSKKQQKQSKKIVTKIKQTFQNINSQSSKSIKNKKYSTQKILLEDQGFGDSCFYIKQILLSLSKDPSLLITIIKKHQALSLTQNLESIIKAIVHNMYENIVDDDIYNKDVFIILEQCFKLIVDAGKNYYDIKIGQDISIAALLVKEFLQRNDIKIYSKQVIRNMVLEIGKIDHQVIFIQEDNQKTQKKDRQNSSLGLNNFRLRKPQSKNQSPVKDQRINPKSKLDNNNSKIIQYSEALQVKDQKIRLSRSYSSQDKLAANKARNKKCVSKDLLKYLGITEQIQFPTFVSSTANNQVKKQEQINKQWAAMLSHKQSMTQINPDIILIKNIVLIFFSDLFKMLYALPLSLRIACKIFYSNLQKKFTSKKACFYVLAEYVLGICVVKNISFEQNSQKSKITNYVKINLNTFSKLIMGVIRNDYKNVPKAFEYEFNLIVSNLRISLFNYMTEIINIDAVKINNLISRNKEERFGLNNCQKIKSYSVCVSISDVKRIFQMIKLCKSQLSNLNKNEKLIKRVERTQMVTEGTDKIFNQRQDKKTKLVYKPQNAFIVFYQLELPKQLSVNYIKYHDGYFKNDKFRKMLKMFFLSIRDIEHFTEFFQESTLFGFLKRLSVKSKDYFQINSMMHIQNIDHIPIQIKVKYLVSLIKNNYLQEEIGSNLFDIISLMYKQALERTQYYKTIWDKSKQCYLKALSSVIYLNQIIINNDQIIRKNIKSKKLDEFIAKTKIAICLTSPSTRQKEIISKTNIIKDLQEQEKGKIWLENQSRCIHSTLNLEFIKSLTGEPDKAKKQDSHCNYIMKFADILCSLPEIRSNSAEDVGVKQAFFEFIKYCCDLALKQENTIFSQDVDWLEESFEQKLSKKIYDKLYPKDPTYEDVAFYLRLKTLDFISYSHLKIKACLRSQKMWQLAGKQLRMMDKVKTAGQKLNCITECSKIIVNSYHLINDSDQPASAEDIYPIVIYVLIKAAPKRMISNMKFIEYFANQNKLVSKQGYAFSQIKSAIQFCDNITDQELEYQGMTPAQKSIEYKKTIYEKQIQYGIYFLLLRKNTSHETQNKNIKFLKDFFSNLTLKV